MGSIDRKRLAALAVLAGLWWLWDGTSAGQGDAIPQVDPGPLPSASLAARRARTAPPDAHRAPAETEPDDRPPRKMEIVVVHLRDASRGFLTFPRRARLDPIAFWPLPGEAPFPAGETAGALQALIDAELPPGDPAEHAWLATAHAEGAADDARDPWAALLALEVARRTALVDQLDDFRAARASGAGPANGAITPEALVGPPATDAVVDMANALVAAHPEHPAAEYARLYLLDAARAAGDTDAAWSLALDMIHNTEDPLVMGQSVALLTTLTRGEPLPAADLDWMGTLYDDFPELVDDIDVAAVGLDHAMMADDRARSRAWFDRLDAAVHDLCAAQPGAVACGLHRDNRDEAAAYIGDLDVADAGSWRQAFEIAGYDCAREGHDWREQPFFRTLATWDGTWRWGPWEPAATGYTACFVDRVRQGPTPDDALLDVRVSIVR